MSHDASAAPCEKGEVREARAGGCESFFIPADPLSLINEVNSSEVDCVQPVEKRLETLTAQKTYAQKIADKLPSEWGTQPEYLLKAEKQRQCASHLMFRQKIDASGEILEENRLTAATFCQAHLRCPICARRRAARLLSSVLGRIHTFLRSDPDNSLFMVTATVRNSENLVETTSKLRDGVRRLLGRRRESKRSGGGGAMCRVTAGVGQIEVKRGSGSGLWHPHYHGLWCVRRNGLPWWNYKEFGAAWKAVTKDKGSHSHICRLRCENEKKYQRGTEAFTERLALDLKEVIKYSVKFEEGREEDVWQIAEILQRKRLMSCFGGLYGVEVDPDLCDPEQEWEAGGEYYERYYSWLGSSYVESEREDWETHCRLSGNVIPGEKLYPANKKFISDIEDKTWLAF